jgi:DNA-binding beta-propeller fold protein YncE
MVRSNGMIHALKIFPVLLAASLLAPAAAGPAAALDPITLEAKIPLGAVRGRIDHLAIDLARHRLFIAELGNGSLGVVDLDKRQVLRRITGLKEPQGVAYDPATDTVYVADGGDGVLHRFKGADLAPLGSIRLGEDADNIRVDAQANQVLVGYADALALLDAATGRKTGDIPLKGHPESFQLEAGGTRVFVNVPEAREIAVADRAAGRQTASWAVKGAQANFPMALDAAGERLMVVFRRPAKLAVLDVREGKTIARLGTCGDADDIFFDTKRQRAYISCGEGAIDVVQHQGDTYASLARIGTAPGARTALFVPELDRLFLAARAGDATDAAIWVFRPTPLP